MEENSGSNSNSHDMTVTLPRYEDIRKATVGETYRYFKKLIEKKSIKNLNEWLSSTTELSLFDANFQFFLIDHLQLEKEVFKILLSQNVDQIKKVLDCKWFFENLPAEFCTKEIFPYISVSLRCKIINRLSRYLKSMEEAEKYFAFIRDNYDNARAEYILPRCSSKFISGYIEKTKPMFDYNTGLRIFMNICRRYPEIGLRTLSLIFEKENASNNFYKYKKVVHCLSVYEPDLMIPFFIKYKQHIPSRTFGRKLTKKIVPKLRQNLFPDFIEDLIFKEKTLFSIISFEEKAKFIAAVVRFYSKDLSSRNWAYSDERLANLLKLVPQDKRQALIDAAFSQVYNVNFNDYPKCWSPEVLGTLPTKTREPYVEKLEAFVEAGTFRKHFGYNCFSPDSPEDFLYLYNSSLAFEKLREILRKTPAANKRQLILVQLVKSCAINKDIKTLQEVVEFVTTRHRNDDNTVIYSFMEAIMDHFPASTLNSTIFEKLEDLAYFCNLRGCSNFFLCNLWREKHIFYRLENGLNVDSHIKTFFDFAILKSYSHTFVHDLRKYDLKHSRFFILALCKETMPLIQNRSTAEAREKSQCLLERVLQTCRAYNELNGSQRIFLREIPGLEGILKEKMKEHFGEVGGEGWSLDVWDRYYNDVVNSFYMSKTLFYVLKRKPDLIEKHLEGILKILFSNYLRCYNAFVNFLLRTVSFYGKMEEMKEIILNEFKNGDSVDKRKIALLLYSHMCTIEEFSNAIEVYLPKTEKIEPGSEEDFNKIQILIPQTIKNVKPYWRNFPLIFKFFFGDFLKRVLSSFYFCCFNTRCDVVLPLLKKYLQEVAPKVSYVKDIIRLIIEVSDRKGRTEFCLQCWKEYKHYSIRSIVLSHVSTFFLELRTQESFGVLEKCILDCDETTVEALPELRNIPDEFLNDYVNALWRFSEIQKPKFKLNFRSDLLRNIDKTNVDLLSPVFCESIIKNYLFEQSSDILCVDNFACAYLVANPEPAETRALFILDIIRDRKPNAQAFHDFLGILISEARNKPSELLTVILQNWPQYPVGVLFYSRVLLTYHILYQKVVKKYGAGDAAHVEFGKELRKFYSSVDNLNELLPIYATVLNNFFLKDYKTHDAILSLKELAAGSRDRAVGVLSILSLPTEAVCWYNKKVASENIAKSKKELSEFVEILESYGDNIVEIYLRSKFEFAK